MNKNSERWQDYPYLVEWVAQMNEWAAKYQIYEFLEADDSGEDPSGRIRRFRDPEFKHSIDGSFVWTVVDEGSEKYIYSGDFWHSSVVGWYVGKVSHNNEKIGLDAGKLACSKCQGESFYEDSEGEEVDCDQCEAGETSVWFDLTDTDFRLPR
jgi:hypothetical protein